MVLHGVAEGRKRDECPLSGEPGAFDLRLRCGAVIPDELNSGAWSEPWPGSRPGTDEAVYARVKKTIIWLVLTVARTTMKLPWGSELIVSSTVSR